MTELDLLDGLVCETKEVLKNYRLRSAKENLIPINVYAQNLPLKEGKDDEKQYPYVCVCFDMESIEAFDTPLLIEVYFLIGVIDKNADKQGYRDVLQIANLIYQHMFRKKFVAGAFSVLRPYKIQLEHEAPFPYFVGGMEMFFEIPVFETEDVLI